MTMASDDPESFNLEVLRKFHASMLRRVEANKGAVGNGRRRTIAFAIGWAIRKIEESLEG